jgi:hypothetical protein
MWVVYRVRIDLLPSILNHFSLLILLKWRLCTSSLLYCLRVFHVLITLSRYDFSFNDVFCVHCMLRYHFIKFVNAMISNGYCVHGISKTICTKMNTGEPLTWTLLSLFDEITLGRDYSCFTYLPIRHCVVSSIWQAWKKHANVYTIAILLNNMIKVAIFQFHFWITHHLKSCSFFFMATARRKTCHFTCMTSVRCL